MKIVCHFKLRSWDTIIKNYTMFKHWSMTSRSSSTYGNKFCSTRNSFFIRQHYDLPWHQYSPSNYSFPHSAPAVAVGTVSTIYKGIFVVTKDVTLEEELQIPHLESFSGFPRIGSFEFLLSEKKILTIAARCFIFARRCETFLASASDERSYLEWHSRSCLV